MEEFPIYNFIPEFTASIPGISSVSEVIDKLIDFPL